MSGFENSQDTRGSDKKPLPDKLANSAIPITYVSIFLFYLFVRLDSRGYPHFLAPYRSEIKALLIFFGIGLFISAWIIHAIGRVRVSGKWWSFFWKNATVQRSIVKNPYIKSSSRRPLLFLILAILTCELLFLLFK